MNIQITNISDGNEALEFIDHRLKDNKYRGSRSSQHNRYTMEQIIIILDLFNKYAPTKQLMVIRDTDISKRIENTPTEYVYAHFCTEAKIKVGIGTQDAMRKNIFVDLHRMGLIERYDNDKTPTNPFSKQHVKYVSLTDQGLMLIETDSLLDQYFIFSKAINRLLGGYIDIILNLLRDDDYGLETISIYEFMFFVSAIDTDTTFNINADKCIKLIRAYRSLSFIQRRAVIETLKKNLKPVNYTGNKLYQRDFHNWHNKAQQIYTLLNQTVYFDFNHKSEMLSLSTKKGFDFKNEQPKRLDRSLNEKHHYFAEHQVKRIEGFELHHVIPLAWSESAHHFKLLDKWLNMVYIDAFSHAKITHNRNRNIVMTADGDSISLCDYDGKEVQLEKDKNIAYKVDKQKDMLDYNQKLLKIF